MSTNSSSSAEPSVIYSNSASYKCGLDPPTFWGLVITIFVVAIITAIIVTYSLINTLIVVKNKKNPRVVVQAVILLALLFKISYFPTQMSKAKMTNIYPDIVEIIRFFLLFIAYGVLMMYWASIYHNVFGVRQGQLYLKKVLVIFWGSVIVWFIFLVLNFIFDHIPQSFTSALDLVYYILVMATMLIFGFGFLIYGILLYKEVHSSTAQGKKERVKKLTKVVIMLTITFITAVIIFAGFVISGGLDTCNGYALGASIAHGFEFVIIYEMLYSVYSKTTSVGSKSMPSTTEVGSSNAGQNSGISIDVVDTNSHYHSPTPPTYDSPSLSVNSQDEI